VDDLSLAAHILIRADCATFSRNRMRELSLAHVQPGDDFNA
jgi:hypothetical protein